MKRFGVRLTDAQMRLARRFERAGLTTISQAVKAFERNDNARIAEWKRQLAELEARQSVTAYADAEDFAV